MLKKLALAIKTPTGMFATLGAVAAIAGYKGAKAAGELTAALREVSTLLPVTVKQMGEMREQVQKLSTEVPRSAPELAKGLYQVVTAYYVAADEDDAPARYMTVFHTGSERTAKGREMVRDAHGGWPAVVYQTDVTDGFLLNAEGVPPLLQTRGAPAELVGLSGAPALTAACPSGRLTWPTAAWSAWRRSKPARSRTTRC
jgi:hypothetical protein